MEEKLILLSKNVSLLTLTMFVLFNICSPLFDLIFSLLESLFTLLESPIPIFAGINISKKLFDDNKLKDKYNNCLFYSLDAN